MEDRWVSPMNTSKRRSESFGWIQPLRSSCAACSSRWLFGFSTEADVVRRGNDRQLGLGIGDTSCSGWSDPVVGVLLLLAPPPRSSSPRSSSRARPLPGPRGPDPRDRRPHRLRSDRLRRADSAGRRAGAPSDLARAAGLRSASPSAGGLSHGEGGSRQAAATF